MIVVDAGHGGIDPGAVGNNIIEKKYNLLISQYIYDRFQELGVPVKMTRTIDETLSPDERVERILNAFGNKSDVVVLSNHLNAGGGDGAEVIYALRDADTLSRIILEEIAKEGQNIRKWYQRRLPSDTSKDYYFIHRETGITEPVLIEYGFLDNTQDAEFIKNNWRNLAEAVVRGVLIYKGIPYEGVLEEGIYIVQAGDTLWTIAKRFNVGVEEIKEVNNLTSNLINIGQELIIPGFPPPTQIEGVTYIVEKGDTLYDIAIAYNTTVESIKKSNNLTSDLLSIGQELIIPTVELPTEPIAGEPLTYTVKAGDTLYSIAQRFNVTLEEIRNLNNLTTNLLSIGQVLLIPVTGKPLTYIVKEGDTLYDIAIAYDTTVESIKSLNNLTSNLLSIGQELLMPTGAVITTGITYIVKAGDNLYSIAERFNVSVNEIKKSNNLTSDLLSIGQELIIPGTNVYIVQAGDNLYSIAEQFNVSVNEIKEANNLTTNLLSIGQELIIPTINRLSKLNSSRQIEGVEKNMQSTIRYRVQRGDTLYSIGNRYGISIGEIRQINNLTTDILRVGQELIIPVIEEKLPEEFMVTIYQVQPGNTLWGIANKYGITVSIIKRINKLTTDIIYPNQELLIPINLPLKTTPGTTQYIVELGDTLYSVANKFNTTVLIIRELNNLTNDIIKPGQILIIPVTSL